MTNILKIMTNKYCATNFIAKISSTVLLILAMQILPAYSCTNILVTSGASANGSTMISYSADSHTLYGELYYRPGKSYPDTATLPIYTWDTEYKINAQIYTGTIKQVKKTMQVVGNMNEKQVVIAETTFGGRDELVDTTGILDYGNLIYISLQRANTAKEAVHLITSLANEYGYNSSGESFSIADPNEVWYLEMISKGVGNKGVVWVALRVPDGYILAHANQSRIDRFALNDPENCLYAGDVIDFARKKNYYNGPDSLFSFVNAYAPVDFHALRFCEARVYSVYNRCNANMKGYEGYIMGDKEQTKLPLFIKPDNKLKQYDVMALMRDHYEQTSMDMLHDAGAGPFECPYRWRPLTWKVDSTEYFNERAISTQQTAFTFVSESRKWLPNEIGGVLWFGVDDAYSTVYTPFYCSITQIPENYREGNGNLLKYSKTSAFWLFNRVANMAYSRYNYMIKDIINVQHGLETGYMCIQDSVEKQALRFYSAKNTGRVKSYLTNYTWACAQKTFTTWENLYEYLTVKYIDGNIKTDDGKLLQPGYPGWWYKMILNNTGERYKIPKEKH